MGRVSRYIVSIAYFSMMFVTSLYIAKEWGDVAQICFIPVCVVLGFPLGTVLVNAKEGE